MKRILLPFPAQRDFAATLARTLDVDSADIAWRRFPDGESLVALPSGLDGADVAIVATFHQPDALALALRFAAATARELGARSVGLVAPYLAYMRQDSRFDAGQALSAPLFAAFLEESFDWLVTVDPHLHRYARLDEIYRKPATRVAAAPAIAQWVRANVADAVLVGPDSESEQWVRDVATRAGVTYQVLAKQRRGDRDVSVSAPDPEPLRGRAVVVIDDIASSGRTFVEALGALARVGVTGATCIAIHAVFAGEAHDELLRAGAARVVSTDTIPHASNAIGVAPLVAAALRERWA